MHGILAEIPSKACLSHFAQPSQYFGNSILPLLNVILASTAPALSTQFSN